MQVTLKRDWSVCDASSGKIVPTIIPAGTHEMERIPNPINPNGEPWLVLAGTKQGAAEPYWRGWENEKPDPDPNNPKNNHLLKWGDSEVVIQV